MFDVRAVDDESPGWCGGESLIFVKGESILASRDTFGLTPVGRPIQTV